MCYNTKGDTIWNKKTRLSSLGSFLIQKPHSFPSGVSNPDRLLGWGAYIVSRSNASRKRAGMTIFSLQSVQTWASTTGAPLCQSSAGFLQSGHTLPVLANEVIIYSFRDNAWAHLFINLLNFAPVIF